MGSGKNEDYGTIAYDAATGTPLWFQAYNGPASDHDTGYDLGVSVDGARVYVTGASEGTSATHFDYATVTYDAATGLQLAVDRYDGPIHGDDSAPFASAARTGRPKCMSSLASCATIAALSPRAR